MSSGLGSTQLAVLATPTLVQRAIGAPVLGTGLVDREGLKKSEGVFQKIKPTQTYGIGDALKFRLVVPFKKLMGKASKDELESLDIYHQHLELQASIDKVKKAYEEYCPAAQAVQDATLQTIDQARAQEYIKAADLVHSYEALIALAAEQADQLMSKERPANAEFIKQAYIHETNIAMTQAVKAQGAVLYTVNKLKAQLYVQFQDVPGKEKALQERFISFVINFEKHVVDACDKFGIIANQNNKQVIAQAFIEGLMDVPGLKMDNIPNFLSLIEEEREARQEKMFEYFFSEMERIVQGDMPITDRLVEGIQYEGIHLVDYVSQLQSNLEYARALAQQFKALESEKTAMENEIPAIMEELRGCEQLLNEGSEYTVGEFLEFLQGPALYPGDPAIEAILNKFPTVKRLVDVKKGIAALEQQSAHDIAKFGQEVAQKEQRLGLLQTAFDEYEAKTAAPCEQEIQRKGQQLAALEETFGKAKQALEGLNDAGRELSLPAVQREFNTRKAALEAEIDGLKAQRDAHRRELERQAAEITRWAGEIALDKEAIESFRVEGTPDVKEDLARLRTEREGLIVSTLKVSGNELCATGKDLAIITKKDGKVHGALAQAREAQEKVGPLKQKLESLEALYKAKEEEINQLREDVIFTEECAILDKESQTLQLLNGFLTDEQKEAIGTRLTEQLNLAVLIGEKIHECLIQKNRAINQQTAEKMKAQGFAAQQIEALQEAAIPAESAEVDHEQEDFLELPGHYVSRRKLSVFAPLVAALPGAAREIPDYSSDTEASGEELISSSAQLDLVEAPSPGLLTRISGWFRDNLGPGRPAAPDYYTRGHLKPDGFLARIFNLGRNEGQLAQQPMTAAAPASGAVPALANSRGSAPAAIVFGHDEDAGTPASASDKSEDEAAASSPVAPAPAPAASDSSAVSASQPVEKVNLELRVPGTKKTEDVAFERRDGKLVGRFTDGREVIGEITPNGRIFKLPDGTVIDEQIDIAEL
ncbi:MAG: hypothetical protein JSS10_01500 [Verrucomicrobia bacterium]|nr:hypothetical protein [Verrucomicrobiota bacterium]